jgi:hypothetical protein
MGVDVADFLGFLREHEGGRVGVEIGLRAKDLADHDRPFAKIDGALGTWRMVDDMDRPPRGVAWVPIGPQDEANVGFYVEADRATEVVVNHIGGKVRFDDGQYVAVVPRD